VVLHQQPAAQVQYRFLCRTPGIDFTPCVKAIERELDALCSLSFQPADLDYLRQFDYFESDFIDFLSLFRLSRRFVRITAAPFELVIEGPSGGLGTAIPWAAGYRTHRCGGYRCLPA
jgi:nicotinate phosphoribosyltransferase